MSQVIELYKELPEGKRDFVLAVVRWAEGSWGDLKHPQTRRFYYLVLRHGVSPTFSRAFEREMEKRWKDATERVAKETGYEGRPLSDWERSSWAAEEAFRDFHYAYQDAFNCNECGKPIKDEDQARDATPAVCRKCMEKFEDRG